MACITKTPTKAATEISTMHISGGSLILYLFILYIINLLFYYPHSSSSFIISLVKYIT